MIHPQIGFYAACGVIDTGAGTAAFQTETINGQAIANQIGFTGLTQNAAGDITLQLDPDFFPVDDLIQIQHAVLSAAGVVRSLNFEVDVAANTIRVRAVDAAAALQATSYTLTVTRRKF